MTQVVNNSNHHQRPRVNTHSQWKREKSEIHLFPSPLESHNHNEKCIITNIQGDDVSSDEFTIAADDSEQEGMG